MSKHLFSRHVHMTDIIYTMRKTSLTQLLKMNDCYSACGLIQYCLLCTYVNTICHYFNLSGFWKAKCLSCYNCNLSRVFCLGAAHITYVNSKSKNKICLITIKHWLKSLSNVIVDQGKCFINYWQNHVKIIWQWISTFCKIHQTEANSLFSFFFRFYTPHSKNTLF